MRIDEGKATRIDHVALEMEAVDLVGGAILTESEAGSLEFVALALYLERPAATKVIMDLIGRKIPEAIEKMNASARPKDGYRSAANNREGERSPALAFIKGE